MLSRKSVSIAAAAFASTSLLPTTAQAAPENLAEEIDALLDRSYPGDGPGAAVVVTENGVVIYRGGQGVADVEAGTPITAETVFRLASITKQFTSATILQLAQEGKLSLDDPLSKFIPDYPADGANVTVRQLLNHTSGIQSYTGIVGWMTEAKTARAFTTKELIDEFKDMPMQFQPGEKFAYNNSGYIVLGAIIEDVTGKSWNDAIVARISEPLGLSSIASFADEGTVPKMAVGYTSGEDDAITFSQKVHANVPGAAGGLRGTVLDLARWADALHGGKVIDQTHYSQMIAPTVLNDGEEEGYGFGIRPYEIRNADAIGHSGGIFGFATNSAYLPDSGIFVAVFANSDSPQTAPDLLINRIAAMALDNPFPEFSVAEVDATALSALFGEYRIGEGETRQFYERDGKLYTLRSGNSETEVFAAGDNRFFYGPDSLTWMSIEPGDDGEMVMKMHQNGAQELELAAYIGPVPEKVTVTLTRETLALYAGTYATPMGDLVVVLGDDGVLTGKLGSQPAAVLTPMSETEFAVEGVSATVTMTVEQEVVTGLVIEQGGQQLPAKRVTESG